MRAPPAAVAAVVLGALLAGCSGKATQGDAGVGLVDLGDGILIDADKALVEGYVVSDAGLVVPHARVSVLGAANYTDSDARGYYRLANLTAGPLELQATHPSYQAHVHRLTAPAGARTHANLTLLPLLSGGTELPHAHDHWGAKTTYVLFDDELDLQRGPSATTYPDEYHAVYNALVRSNQNVTGGEDNPWMIPLEESPDGPALVLPGTKQMDVTVAWDEDTIITEGFGICYVPANRDPLRCLAPQASPAHFTIDVTPAMADAGHQPYSLWRIYLYTRGATQANGGNPDVTYGVLDIDIVLTKGEVLVDLPHPDFWSGGNEWVVVGGREQVGPSTCCSQVGPWYPEKIVPPGTTKLRIEHKWEAQGAGAQVPVDYRLHVRTAAMNPHSTQRGDWESLEPVSGSAAEKKYVYERTLEPQEADGYYQTSSFWRFGVYQPKWGPTGYEIVGYPITHTLNVTAIREA